MQPSNTARPGPMIGGIPVESALMALAVAAIIAAMIFHLVTLETYPLVNVDEGWFSSAAWNWVMTGSNFDIIHTGPLDQYGYEWIRRYFLGEAPWSLTFAVLGVGLYQARLASLIIGGLLIIVLILIGRYQFSLQTGLVAGLILVVSFPFMWSSHFARQDILLALTVLIAYSLGVYALNSDKLYVHFLAGLILGISPDVHENGLLFVPALGAMYLFTYNRRLFVMRGTWLAALGGVIGLFVYAAIHLLPNYAVYTQLNGFFYGEVGALIKPDPLSLARSLVGEISRYRFFENNFAFGMVIASGLYMVRRFSKSDRLLLIYVGIAFLGFLILVLKKDLVYGIILYPFFSLLVAETTVSLLREGRKLNAQNIFVGALLVCFLGYSTVANIRLVSTHRQHDYNAITNQIKAVMPKNSRVLGWASWYIGLTDYEYLSSHNIPFYEFYNHYTVSQALEVMRPDFIIIDEALRFSMVDEGEAIHPMVPEAYTFSKSEFLDFLNAHGQVALELNTPNYGLLQVYSLDYSE